MSECSYRTLLIVKDLPSEMAHHHWKLWKLQTKCGRNQNLKLKIC